MDQVTVFAAASFLVVGFIVLLYRIKLVNNAISVIDIARRSLEVMGDPLLSDDVKESRMQQNALSLFRLFFRLLAGGALALAVPMALIWSMDYLGWLSFDAVVELALDWRFLAGSTLVGIIIYKLRLRDVAARDTADFENRYSGLDRMLHAIAFAMMPAQKSLSSLEDRMYSKRLARIDDRPVFITGLPRSGTTLLLDLFHQLPEFATHTYRHMPFLMIPLLWGKFASSFRAEDTPRERAHGDGMKVSLDSPEAFEEALWIHFWPRHFRDERITPWPKQSTDRFDHFFSQHRKKICVLDAERSEDAHNRRYISKNNLNISRVELLLHSNPRALIILPFRDPYQHAASLLFQHINFHDIQEQDPFARRYMSDIGHFDFGLNLKPVDFDNWLASSKHTDATTLSFWLNYWLVVYQHLLALDDERILLSDFDNLCEAPAPALARLAEFTGIDDTDTFISQADQVRPQRTHEIDKSELDRSLLDRVDTLYARLQQTAVTRNHTG